MSSRELILARVRANQPGPRELPTLPAPAAFAAPPSGWLVAFGSALERMGGELLPAPASEPLAAVIRRRFPTAAVICSATPEVQGNKDLVAIRRPGELADVDVGIVRAAFGIAETGSVFLSEHETGVNAIAFLPQHLVVLLDPAAIVPDLHHAYRQRGFFDARYAVLMTGPSATADIEGVLIRGAQGVRSFSVIPVPAPEGLAAPLTD